jgi:hypothetical protein
MRRIFGVAVPAGVVVAALAACGPSGSNNGGGGSGLDCAWLASDNCWKMAVAAASSCLPPSSAIGTLSADGKTCTFTSGQIVAFDSPLTLPVSTQNMQFNFSVTANGSPCLTFKQPDAQGFQVKTSAGTVTASASATSTETVTCPGGMEVSNSNALSLLSCDAGFFGGLPGDAYSSSDTSVTFEIVGTSDPTGSVQIFQCQK